MQDRDLDDASRLADELLEITVKGLDPKRGTPFMVYSIDGLLRQAEHSLMMSTYYVVEIDHK